MLHYGGRPPKQTSLFWRETRQRILGPEISPYPEVVRGRERELTTRPRERQLVVGQEQRQLVAGQEREKLVAGEQRGKQQNESCSRRPRRAVETGQERGEQQKLAWKNGGAVNTRHRAESRGDKIGSSEEESQDV